MKILIPIPFLLFLCPVTIFGKHHKHSHGSSSEENTINYQVPTYGYQIQAPVAQGCAGLRSMNGDILTVKYTGTYQDGTVFDSSAQLAGGVYKFTLGAGQSKQNWDQGLLDMCEGEHRKILVTTTDTSYATGGMSLPVAGSTSVQQTYYDVDLVRIERSGYSYSYQTT